MTEPKERRVSDIYCISTNILYVYIFIWCTVYSLNCVTIYLILRVVRMILISMKHDNVFNVPIQNEHSSSDVAVITDPLSAQYNSTTLAVTHTSWLLLRAYAAPGTNPDFGHKR